MNSESRTQVVVGVVVLVVVLIGGWLITARERSGMPANDTMATTLTSATSSDETNTPSMGAGVMSGTKNPTAIGSGDNVTVVNQAHGSSVMVKSVTLSEKGWVAVRDNAGRTLGAALVQSGTHANVSVPLLRATVAGERYQILLYFDNGDKKFDLHSETLVENADGSVAGAMFSAQ